jgi:arylsulfatase A-like enzyme
LLAVGGIGDYFRRVMIGRVLILCAGIFFASSAGGADKLNVIVFLSDDLGQRDLGCYGSTFYQTPNLDKLARQGMRFTQAYSACPVCSPTRASLMTGRWPQRTGVTDFIGAAQPDKWNRPTKLLPAPYSMQLALDETTLGEVLGRAGYATMHAGKWHLGGRGHQPDQQGFGVNLQAANIYFAPFKSPALAEAAPGDHIADRLAKECGKFIEANRDKPFFLNYWLYDVHSPHMAKPELTKKYQAKAVAASAEKWGQEGERKVRLTQNHAVYAAMVETMDASVGAVLAMLDKLGLADRTLVIFTSDNGGLSTSEGWVTSNLPFRAGKGWLYEGGVRVPLLVRWPRIAKPGTSDRVVASPDVFATIVEACGLPAVKSAHDGVSFAATLRGEKQPARETIYWHYPHYGNQGGFPGGALRDGDWKLVERYDDGSLELYDLATDVGEQKNLAASEPERTKSYVEKLKAWRGEVGAKMPSYR